MNTRSTPPTLDELKTRLAPLVARYPIRRLEVFGSVARGDAQAESDVDLLVTLSREISTDELLSMAGEAEELAGAPVDFVLRENVERLPRLEKRECILNSAVCIYGS